jgi:hypothetical protein
MLTKKRNLRQRGIIHARSVKSKRKKLGRERRLEMDQESTIETGRLGRYCLLTSFTRTFKSSCPRWGHGVDRLRRIVVVLEMSDRAQKIMEEWNSWPTRE